MARKKQGSDMTALRRPSTLLYSRVSSQGPSLENVSIDDQMKAITQLCASRGWYVVAKHDDREIEE